MTDPTKPLGRLLAFWSAMVLTVSVVADSSAAPRSDPTIVNAQALTNDELQSLRRLGVQAQPGRYWYDAVSGAWGFERGPTAGFIAAGLRLGGALRPDASGGGTGVFINGRELHPFDVIGLSQIVQVIPGRWWVNALGFFGPEGGPVWGNLWLLARQRQGDRSPWSGYSSDGKQFLGFDGSGNGYFQGSNPVGGPTTW